MTNVSVSEVLIRATRDMLKEYSSIRFFSNYERNERKINANVIINLFESILRKIRESHPNGDKLYLVLYHSYFYSKKLKRNQLCDILGAELVNRTITESTLYRWQQNGIKVFAYALWTNPELVDITLSIFESPYLKRNYNAILEEHKRLKNG